MASTTVIAAALAATALVSVQASAKARPPLIPTALVEDIKSASAEVEFMDYVGSGQVIKLGAGEVLVLSYLKSCEQETITGGTVTVGAERSEVQDGKVVRAKVSCAGGKIQLSAAEASKSGAAAFRLQSAPIEPILHGQAPMIQLPKTLSENRTLVIERLDRKGDRHEYKIDESIAAGSYYDLNKVKAKLARGGIYDASVGGKKITFKIDEKAKPGQAPVISRLLRFQ